MMKILIFCLIMCKVTQGQFDHYFVNKCDQRCDTDNQIGYLDESTVFLLQLSSSIRSAGQKGEPGKPGSVGMKGEKGSPGVSTKGNTGEKGSKGEEGKSGPFGLRGLKGTKGDVTICQCKDVIDLKKQVEELQRAVDKLSSHSTNSTLLKIFPKPKCKNVELGVKDSAVIKDRQLSASSFYNKKHLPKHGRLDYLHPSYYFAWGGWLSKFTGVDEWIQVDMIQMLMVSGVITQGDGTVAPDLPDYLTYYRVSYSTGGTGYQFITNSNNLIKVFPANDDGETHVPRYFDAPVTARYIRILPFDWVGSPTFRFEVMLC